MEKIKENISKGLEWKLTEEMNLLDSVFKKKYEAEIALSNRVFKLSTGYFHNGDKKGSMLTLVSSITEHQEEKRIAWFYTKQMVKCRDTKIYERNGIIYVAQMKEKLIEEFKNLYMDYDYILNKIDETFKKGRDDSRK